MRYGPCHEDNSTSLLVEVRGMAQLIFASVATIFSVAVWAFWFSCRAERTLNETILVFNLARNVDVSPNARQAFPNVARLAKDELPGVRRALIADVARKVGRTPEAIEEALLADTGSRSLDEALQSSAGSSTVENTLLGVLVATRDPVRLLARRVVARSRHERWLRLVEKLILPLAIFATLVALTLLAASARAYFA
jgi:hypothetical protein